MGYEPWTARRRRLASVLTSGKVRAWDKEFDLPYCGDGSPFPSDYVVPAWAPTVLEAAQPIFTGTFVDVGANVGQTLIAVKNHDPDWDYVGFEPNPVSWLVAQRLAVENGFRKYRIIPSGLSDAAGVMELTSNSPTDPSASVIKDFRDPATYPQTLRTYVTVLDGSVTLKALGSTHIGMIKIDVEGGELEVLRGLERTLRDCRPVVICEILPIYDASTKNGAFRLTRQREIEQNLRRLEYATVRFEPPNLFRPMVEIAVHGDLNLTDYIFVPNERLEELIARLVDHKNVVER